MPLSRSVRLRRFRSVTSHTATGGGIRRFTGRILESGSARQPSHLPDAPVNRAAARRRALARPLPRREPSRLQQPGRRGPFRRRADGRCPSRTTSRWTISRCGRPMAGASRTRATVQETTTSTSCRATGERRAAGRAGGPQRGAVPSRRGPAVGRGDRRFDEEGQVGSEEPRESPPLALIGRIP